MSPYSHEQLMYNVLSFDTLMAKVSQLIFLKQYYLQQQLLVKLLFLLKLQLGVEERGVRRHGYGLTKAQTAQRS